VIKIVMSGTNEAKPPRFKDLRVIALAWFFSYDTSRRTH
jgi:hypothetical protein